MKKLKRPLALLLALMLTVSICSNSSTIAFATELPASMEEEVEPDDEKELSQEEREAEAPKEVVLVSNVEIEEVEEELAQAEIANPTEELEDLEEQDDSVTQENPEKAETPETVSIATQETTVETDATIAKDVDNDTEIEKIDAYLVVNDDTVEKFGFVSIQSLLDMLVDSNGEKINITESTTLVRIYFIDLNGNLLQDEYYELQLDETTKRSQFGIGAINVGSPVITIITQTFQDIANKDDTNTIPDEFHQDNDESISGNIDIDKSDNTIVSDAERNGSSNTSNSSKNAEKNSDNNVRDTNKTEASNNLATEQERSISDNKVQFSSPKTGDNAALKLWLVMLFVACVGLLLLSRYDKKKVKDKK